MTLDEAIQHLRETLADENHKWTCEKCRQEHIELLSFLLELKSYRITYGMKGGDKNEYKRSQIESFS